MQKYVNPLSDAGFKALLCDPANKKELAAMLNVLLPADRKIADLEYATTEIPGLTLSNKASRVDLRCTDRLGRNFIVEVQRSPQPNFFRRCVYYASRIYTLGSQRGDEQRYDLQPVYLIALTDRDFGYDRNSTEWSNRYTAWYTFREMTSGQVEDDTISIIFAELHRFCIPTYEECRTEEERWYWMLKNMSRLQEDPGETGTLYLEFSGLLEAARIAGFSKEKRAKYDTDMITERDMYNILETAREEGRETGLAEGRAEVARKMLAAGMPESQITAFTGLTSDQLKEL